MAERRFTGKPAAPGLAIGPLVRLQAKAASSRREQGSPAEERAALDQAVAKALADLEALAAVASGDGADILAFQIEMLSDPALIEDALSLIEDGEDAATAWEAGLDSQIAVYEAADDAYFKARASDLEDLQDRVLRALEGRALALPDLPPGAILLAEDLGPSLFLALSAKGLCGIALSRGSASSHVAILARGRGLPMVVGLEPATEGCEDGDNDAILDADAGLLLHAPKKATLKRYLGQLSSAATIARRAAALRDQPAMTADGTRIELMINVDDPDAIDDRTLEAADGVGLLRSEFLLIGREDLPDETAHYRHYTSLQRRLGGKPLVVRTLDIGGDKPHPGLDLPIEHNPFLGLRGIRLTLARPPLFAPQLRALLRAAAEGPLQVMLPMVSTDAEVEQTRTLMAACLDDLNATGTAAAMPALGIMVETPAAAIAADQLNAAFFSIGSNDLIQYVMAAARDAEGEVAALLDPGHPAIERLITSVVEQAHATGKEVSLCGDMASDPGWLPLLLRTGLRKLSVAPGALDRVKLGLAEIDLGAEAGTGATRGG